MKKKLLVASIFLVSVGLIITRTDPLPLIVNFMVGGIVPGLDISIGFFTTLAIVAGSVWIIKQWVQALHFQMIRRTALEMNAEKTRQELAQATQKESKKRRRALVAAQKLKTGATSL